MGGSFIGLIPPHLCVFLKPGPEFPTSYVVGFCVQSVQFDNHIKTSFTCILCFNIFIFIAKQGKYSPILWPFKGYVLCFNDSWCILLNPMKHIFDALNWSIFDYYLKVNLTITASVAHDDHLQNMPFGLVLFCDLFPKTFKLFVVSGVKHQNSYIAEEQTTQWPKEKVP